MAERLQFAFAARMDEEDAPQQLKKLQAVHLFEKALLSRGKAVELAGMRRWGSMNPLEGRKIPLYCSATAFGSKSSTATIVNRMSFLTSSGWLIFAMFPCTCVESKLCFLLPAFHFLDASSIFSNSSLVAFAQPVEAQLLSPLIDRKPRDNFY